MAEDARGKLKEVGDVQNWAEVMERELLVLEETVRIVEEEKKASGDGEGQEREGKGRKKKRWFW